MMAFYKQITKFWQNLIGDDNPKQAPAPAETVKEEIPIAHESAKSLLKEQNFEKVYAKREKAEKPKISHEQPKTAKPLKSEKLENSTKPLKAERTRKADLKKRNQERHIEDLQKQFTTRKF